MRIVYFDIDSLRPDHLGCYGYSRQTSPNIDKLARQSVRFNNTYCVSSPCVPARSSIVSGRFGINHGVMTHWREGCDFYYPEGDFHSQEMPFFTRYLREANHRTITFSSFGDRHHAWWFFAGWNEVHTHTLKGGTEDADEVNEAVLPWIKEHGAEDNYFLHIQYWDPHVAYTYPKEYKEQFVDDSVKAFPDEATIQEHRKDSHPRSAKFLHWTSDPSTLPQETMPYEVKNRDDYKKLIDGYDGGISYMDKHIGQIVQAYRELGIEEEICFIITADHGESFGEQGMYLEHGMATEAVHHIPLIVRVPGMKEEKVNDNFIYNIDIMATVTDMLQLPVPSGWDGKSFLPALRGEDMEGRDYLVLEHGLYACQRAVVDKRWYYLYTYHEGFYHMEKEILYDLENDPHQTKNVASVHRDVVDKMYNRLSRWIDDNLAKSGLKKDPMREILASGGPFRYLEPEDWVLRLENENWYEAAEDYRNRFIRETIEY